MPFPIFSRACAGRRTACTLTLCAAVVLCAVAMDVRAACRASSAYDLTVTAESLVFEAAEGAARRIEMRAGRLADGGKAVALGPADRDRVLRFERVVRSLVPRVRALGARAVDLATLAVRDEAAATSPTSARDPELNAKVDARAADLKARIARSTTSKEWRGAAFRRYTAAALADVAPLIGGDLAREALAASLRGEFSRAAALGERAAGVRASLEHRIAGRLAVLQPEIERLCPAVRELDRLESGVTARLADGTRLDLVAVGP